MRSKLPTDVHSNIITDRRRNALSVTHDEWRRSTRGMSLDDGGSIAKVEQERVLEKTTILTSTGAEPVGRTRTKSSNEQKKETEAPRRKSSHHY